MTGLTETVLAGLREPTWRTMPAEPPDWFMAEYPKIQSLYKRGPGGEMLLGQWSTPELEWLRDCEWLWTEKVDGTNVRIGWDPAAGSVRVGGRTDRAQMPPALLKAFSEMNLLATLGRSALPRATIYGEGYGAGIQKGGGDYGQPSFIVFDVVIDGWWLSMGDAQDVADKLGLECVPVVGTGTLGEMEEAVRLGVYSELTAARKMAEGLVARTLPGLRDRRGRPVLTKIRARDLEGPDALK
jgi:hypothetical protein